MKNALFFISFTLLTFISSAQINFESGYFINNADIRTECFIKNIDWKNNPDKFNYKLVADGETSEALITNIKEFGIYNFSKYVRESIQIDLSTSDIGNLSLQKTPEWSNKTIFLKLVVEGKANLYHYEDGDFRRYFFKTNDLPIQQLVYKQYRLNSNKIYENAAFRQQLSNNVNCDKISTTTIKNLNYKLVKLEQYFIKYNECFGETNSSFKAKKNKATFKLHIKPGITYSTLNLKGGQGGFFSLERDFDPKIGYRIGIEAETILPFNRNKWSLLVEPNYQSFKTEDERGKVKYNSLEIPMGIRHYFFLNDTAKIFINGLYILDIPFNSTIDPGFEITRNSIFGFGLGFQKNKYSFEVRYFNKNLLADYLDFDTNHRTISFIFGYTLL